MALAAALMFAAFTATAQAATPYPIQALAEATTSRFQSPVLATDAEGDQIAVWTHEKSGESLTEAAIRPAGGRWGAPVAISPAGKESLTPDVAVNGKGEAIASWMRETVAGRFGIEVTRLGDIAATSGSSSTWSSPTLVSTEGTNSQQPSVGIDAAGVATVAWRQAEPNLNYGFAVASEVGAGTWSAPEFLTEREPAGSDEAPELVVNPAGDAVIVAGRSTAIEAADRPAGGSWSPAVTVVSEPNQGLSQYSVAMDAAGEVTLAFEDSIGNNPPSVIRVATKPLEGSWTAPQTVSNSANRQSAPVASVTSDGYAFVAWLDNSSSVQSVERQPGGSWTAPSQGPAVEGSEGLYNLKGGIDEAGDANLVIEGEATGNIGSLWLVRHSASAGWTQPAQLTAAEEEAYGAGVSVDGFGDTAIGWRGYGQSGAIRYVNAISIDNSAKLDVSRSGTGSGSVKDDTGAIDCGTTCAARYALGTEVTLTATPDAGSVFSGWSGACTGSATCTVTIDAAKSVVAEFSPPKGTGTDTKPKSTTPAPTANAAPQVAPLRLIKVKRNKARGIGTTRYRVPAAGTLTVYGNGVKKTSVKVSAAGFKLVKLTPKGAYKARLLRNHRGFTIVKAKFRPADGGKVTTQTRRIRLVWRHG